ncbi:MAG TPA: VWA domain-containing protein [Pyrinomonadaceae bacterium]|nr:VWA domain-containing protein [Pyrinomonadaceae bacterium]
MKFLVVAFACFVLLLPAVAFTQTNNPPAQSRPRRVHDKNLDSGADRLPDPASSTEPKLKLNPISLDAPEHPSGGPAKAEEVGEGDVLRIDTNLVTVPVSVMDRQGKFISDLRREQFHVFENGVEQQIAHFAPTGNPFTVALLLDTSGSTFFHLWEIKEAAIAFAKQLRPQDRVLVVTFDRLVMLLTEATNDLNVVTEVIQRDAITGFSTRLYDAVDLVIKRRLNKIPGRKAIVLFTDGVDTASYQASYKSTLRAIDELDVLIYPVQYDTIDFINATLDPKALKELNDRNAELPTPKPVQRASDPNYKRADEYLQQLADKTGARLYQANDRAELSAAFSKIAGELRCQYSLGYYPPDTIGSDERRQIKVRVDRTDVAVRARDSYVRSASSKPSQK